MKKVLLSWELMPEAVSFYIIDMTEEEYEMFSKTHGHFIGAETTSEEVENLILILNQSLCSVEDHYQYCESDLEKAYFGKWKDCGLDSQDLTEVTHFLQTGQYL